MFLLINGNKTEVSLADFKRLDNLHIAEYGTGGLGKYENTVGLVIELYNRLKKTDIDSKLLSKIAYIVEVLTNLKHFQVDMSRKSEGEIVLEVVSRFDTFNYKKLELLDLSNDFKLLKTVSLDCHNVESFIQGGSFDEYCISKSNEDFCVNIITRNETRRIVSILESGNHQTVITEFADGLKRIAASGYDRKHLEDFCFFTMTIDGMHTEMAVIVERLKSTLLYILNSYSYWNHGYFDFDAIEIERRLSFDLDYCLKRFKSVASYQLEQHKITV